MATQTTHPPTHPPTNTTSKNGTTPTGIRQIFSFFFVFGCFTAINGALRQTRGYLEVAYNNEWRFVGFFVTTDIFCIFLAKQTSL